MQKQNIARRKLSPQQQTRKVLTFYGDRGWHDPVRSDGSDADYNSSSLVRGYQKLNLVVNDLAQRVTIHSVSYSHTIFPSSSNATLVRLFATVVYTGPSALSIYGPKNPHGRGEITANMTTLEVDPL